MQSGCEVSKHGASHPQKPPGLQGGWEIIYLPLLCRHQKDSCMKMGSDESRFSVSLIVTDKVTRLSTNHNRFEEKGGPTEAESSQSPSANQPKARS